MRAMNLHAKIYKPKESDFDENDFELKIRLLFNLRFLHSSTFLQFLTSIFTSRSAFKSTTVGTVANLKREGMLRMNLIFFLDFTLT